MLCLNKEKMCPIILIFYLKILRIYGTIDINLPELQYLAAHLDLAECRKLIAALHYTGFELPKSVASAERKVDEDIPCLDHLLHWNSSPGEGRGQTHGHLENRLRQIGRNDLADWLGKTVFAQLGEDLSKALNPPTIPEIQPRNSIVLAPLIPKEDTWEPVDDALLAVLVLLLIGLGFLMVVVAIKTISTLKKRYLRRKIKKCHCKDAESESELTSFLTEEEIDESN